MNDEQKAMAAMEEMLKNAGMTGIDLAKHFKMIPVEIITINRGKYIGVITDIDTNFVLIETPDQVLVMLKMKDVETITTSQSVMNYVKGEVERFEQEKE